MVVVMAEQTYYNEYMSKNRGGQEGNANALKHGFYSEKFRVGEVTDLDRVGVKEDLTDEIKLARVMTRRLLETLENVTDIESKIAVAGLVGNYLSRLGGLMRVQKFITTGESGLGEALQQALDEINQELMR